jgi:GrpB-like predicted nucleotidyltransferase (UPF0157 family)
MTISESPTPELYITVVPYNPQWPQLFEEEASLIRTALGENCTSIHHIGSTAVPLLCAKPIIDIMPLVKDIDAVDACTSTLQKLGYTAKGEFGIPGRRYFQKSISTTRTHHVHVYQENDPQHKRYILFRDWLCTHPEDREVYGAIKQKLATLFPNDIESYCTGKDDIVAIIDEKAKDSQ